MRMHDLLAAALIGKPADGWRTGERPSARAVAACRDKAVGAEVTGVFHLVNWTGLQPDGSLAEGLTDDSPGHWIALEACPADIVPFEGRRVVPLEPPPYDRSWQAGRQFPGMTGELERILPPAEVEAWLARLLSAAR